MTRRRDRLMRIKFNRECRRFGLLHIVWSPTTRRSEWKRYPATHDHVRSNVALLMGHPWVHWLLRRDPDVLNRTTAGGWQELPSRRGGAGDRGGLDEERQQVAVSAAAQGGGQIADAEIN